MGSNFQLPTPNADRRSDAPRLLLVGLAAFTLVALAQACTKAPPVESTSVAELAERIRAGTAPLILDVRTPEEFAAGHIPGAVNIPYDQLESRLAELPAEPDTEIVVHCKSGHRAGIAEETLSRAGYENLEDLKGHWQAWSAADLPVE
jgi:rhodanese-related sulfurtransferase